MVITIIMILAGIGGWRLNTFRDKAQAISDADMLVTIKQMQQLASFEGIVQSNTDVYLRLVELQAGLAAAGHANFKIDPQLLSRKLTYTFTPAYSVTTWSLK